MSNDTTAWATPTATPSSAAGGLIQTATTYAATANNAGNTVRWSAYENVIAAASDFRRVLLAFDPQGDSAAETIIATLLASL